MYHYAIFYISDNYVENPIVSLYIKIVHKLPLIIRYIKFI